MNEKKVRVLDKIAQIPLQVILFCLALCLTLWGLYALSPIYQPASSVAIAFGSLEYPRVIERYLGGVYLILGGWYFLGKLFKKKSMVYTSPLLIMLGFFFLCLLRIITVGLLPVSWLPLLVLAIVAGIVRLHMSWQRRQE